METQIGPLTEDRVREILSLHNGFYKKLNEDGKSKFEQRLQRFLHKKEFVPKENVDVTAGMDNIKTLVGAAAIQLTFGMEKFELEYFSRVFIYPSQYYSNITKHWHKGEANPMGALVFSWKDLQAGADDTDNKLNVGIHEMAHALLISMKLHEGSDEFFKHYFDKWWAVSNSEFVKLQQHQTSFFRQYGGSNQQEFFAVCMECFFEQAVEFKENHPEIYRQTCILLNQDPSGDVNITTTIRTRELCKPIPEVVPGMLQYNSPPVNYLLKLGMLVLGALIFLGFIAFNGGGSSIAGPIVMIGGAIFIGMAVIALSKYARFYIYDNAFEVEYERLGKNLPNANVYNPAGIVSFGFVVISGKSDTYLLEINIIGDGEVEKVVENYTYMSAIKRDEMESQITEFAKKNNIAIYRR